MVSFELNRGIRKMAGTVTLYSYWRSQASYRVRVALALKGIGFETISLDLIKGDQHDAKYRAINPEMVVPALIDGDGPPLVQSLAILEYLDESHPQPPLLPKGVRERAHVRAIAQMVAMDAHPFIVPRVRKYLTQDLKLDDATRNKWLSHWLSEGTRSVEETLARDKRAGRFCYGDSVTIADICLAAHLVSANMLVKLTPDPYPNVKRVFDNCMATDAFASTHPFKQPGAEAGH